MAARIAQQAGAFDLGQNAEINVTPFVDIMLVLLIVFMVAAPIATATLKVDLPPLTSGAEPTREPVYVDVGPAGRLYVEGRATSLDKLLPDLVAAIDRPRPTAERVMIRGDKTIAYGEFMRVMNILQNGGFHRVALVGEQD